MKNCHVLTERGWMVRWEDPHNPNAGGYRLAADGDSCPQCGEPLVSQENNQ